ncbi:hypothetical protein [Companilactobacillus farciminis]|uniref:hypothetical protein n=1 Tax=Companilactobacillus farciminis TaxID=1612 RepID=UPI001915858C|nr:hypothetical protein [Companilactobacillus farciminis]
MKRTKRIRFNKKPLLTSLAVLSIAATGLSLLQATNVQAADYTAEEVQEIFAGNQGGYWYHHDFDTSKPWDGTVLTPEEAADIQAQGINYKPQENDGNSATQEPSGENNSSDNSELPSSSSIFYLEGVLTVNNVNSTYCQLFSFSKNGEVSLITNRALANNTKWFTDQYRIHNGHYYYRVATNEWVQGTVVINFGPL